MIYKYNDKIYFNEDDLDDAIVDGYDNHKNNSDPADYIDYDTIMIYDVERADKNDFSTFKAWCDYKGLVASHYNSLARYMKEVE